MRPQSGERSKLHPDQEQSCSPGKRVPPVPPPRPARDHAASFLLLLLFSPSYPGDSCTPAPAVLLAKHRARLRHCKGTAPSTGTRSSPQRPPTVCSPECLHNIFLPFKFSVRRDSKNLNPFTFSRGIDFQHNRL